MSTAAIWISVVALVVSIGSLVVSTLNFRRDMARLRVTAEFFNGGPEYGPPYIRVRMVNVGRRPIVVRLIGGSSGERSGASYLNHADGGKRLGEHEQYEQRFDKSDLWDSGGPVEDGFFYEELWVEDSVGIRYVVPNSREHIQKMLAQ